MTMRAALRSSSNRIAVETLQEIGIPAAVNAAQRLGITGQPAVPSLALGSGEVTLLAMTSAFAAFGNQGMRPLPVLIRRVETTDGEVLFEGHPRAERAVSEATAFLMTSMLSDVIDAGTAWQARRVGFKAPAAGKTGTTNEYRDAWFIGYTPSLATGVWIGYDQPRTIIAGGYAGDLAVPLWGRFMAAATKDQKPEAFPRPPTIRGATICRLTGKLATETCRGATVYDDEGKPTNRSSVYTEYFVRGTEPTEYCDHDHALYQMFAAKGGVLEDGVPAAAAPIATGGALSVGIVPPSVNANRPEAAATATPAKRGFWSRFFGIGGDDDAKEPPPAQPAPQPAPSQPR
jgi:penicillin-binding protein 1A